MWPFDLRKRRYKRRYNAAIVVLLGAYMPGRLDGEQRKQVESALADNLRRSSESPAAWKRWGQWDVLAAFRAVAMEKAGIEPAIPGLSWDELFEPWRFWRKIPNWPLPRGFDSRPTWLLLDYRPGEQATNDAKAFLRRSGMELPDADPWASGSLESIDGTDSWLKRAGLLDHWQNGR